MASLFHLNTVFIALRTKKILSALLLSSLLGASVENMANASATLDDYNLCAEFERDWDGPNWQDYIKGWSNKIKDLPLEAFVNLLKFTATKGIDQLNQLLDIKPPRVIKNIDTKYLSEILSTLILNNNQDKDINYSEKTLHLKNAIGAVKCKAIRDNNAGHWLEQAIINENDTSIFFIVELDLVKTEDLKKFYKPFKRWIASSGSKDSHQLLDHLVSWIYFQEPEGLSYHPENEPSLLEVAIDAENFIAFKLLFEHVPSEKMCVKNLIHRCILKNQLTIFEWIWLFKREDVEELKEAIRICIMDTGIPIIRLTKMAEILMLKGPNALATEGYNLFLQGFAHQGIQFSCEIFRIYLDNQELLINLPNDFRGESTAREIAKLTKSLNGDKYKCIDNKRINQAVNTAKEKYLELDAHFKHLESSCDNKAESFIRVTIRKCMSDNTNFDLGKRALSDLAYSLLFQGAREHHLTGISFVKEIEEVVNDHCMKYYVQPQVRSVEVTSNWYPYDIMRNDALKLALKKLGLEELLALRLELNRLVLEFRHIEGKKPGATLFILNKAIEFLNKYNGNLSKKTKTEIRSINDETLFPPYVAPHEDSAEKYEIWNNRLKNLGLPNDCTPLITIAPPSSLGSSDSTGSSAAEGQEPLSKKLSSRTSKKKERAKK